MGIIRIGSINCQGQSRLSLAKQLQIQSYIESFKIDILFCQETFIENDSFSQCSAIRNRFNIIKNNSQNEYGTAVLVSKLYDIKDVTFDTEGRIIIFNSGDTTFCNVYPKAGTDGDSRRER